MSYSSGFQAPGSWSWPDDLPRNAPFQESSQPTSGSTSQKASSNPAQGSESPHTSTGTRSGRTHWPPRQCRICLETVQPTFNAASESLPGFLQSPSVVYSDETGRLIRPCNCKGSSKYVHDACLQAWRHADPGYGKRNYWQCPTCGFKYRLARLGAGRFVGSVAAQIALTAFILFFAIFVLGFVADPIIGLYVDPWSYMPWSSHARYDRHYYYEDDESGATWYEHFAKGFASMGVLGFLKVLLASPFSYFRLGGGGRARTGRDRVEQVSWIIIVIGVGTFLVAVYKGVRAWSRRTLERAGERVMDVGNDDDDDE